MNCASCRGLTLTEILMAGVLAFGIIIGVSMIGLQRDRLIATIRGPGNNMVGELQPPLRVIGMIQTLETADRVRMPSLGVIQARVFAPQGACAAEPYGSACFDDATNYRWIEYAHADTDGVGGRDALQLYTDTANGCAQKRIISTQITALTFNYVDYVAAPPGGDPAAAVFSPSPRDVNLVQYMVQWTGPLSGMVLVPPPASGLRRYRGIIAMRHVPYSDNGAGTAGLTDSGLGLTNSAVAPPPAPCCVPLAPCT